ncbi:single-stranded-DNA-specific exonuclease RecJ [Tundrisphaera sp. TA3]|uniref:single-stranded-DNA-specific exonuclease RecJ n=1 Tax=Tundrisphaera sp. TA3 TaxID=3435775 RepID=UPI003EBC5056
MTTRWRLRPFDADRVASLSREASIPPLIAQLLLNRGVADGAGAASFFDTRLVGLHDPESLPGVVEAADAIVKAVRDRRRIVIYGDYDVDGVCGTSILWDCLRLAGSHDVRYYIPHRVEEGYGINADALRKIAEMSPGALVVTVDCGISAVAETRLARELGLGLIITDHHTIGPALPEPDVLVHPRLPGGSYPFGELCGCAVAFKLAWQICKGFGDGKKASPHLRDFLIRSIGLVAMATVADVMPVHGENRILIHHGLSGLAKTASEGLKALMEISGVVGKKALTTSTIGFGLAPRINAAGRLERAMHAVEMLTTDDADRARELAVALDECNARRQQVERAIVEEAHAIIDAQGGLNGRGAIVLGRPTWHPGVIGIVASRLAEAYHRPAIIVALGPEMGQGSARSVSGFNLYDAIHACSERLTGFGGHSAAAGIKLPIAHFEAFAEQFEAHCRQALSAEQLQKTLNIDAEVPLGTLTLKVVESIEALEPHGIGNPRPLLVANNVKVIGEPRTMGERQDHVRIRIAQGNTTLGAIGWRMAERAKVLRNGTPCAIAFHPSVNEWNGRREVQLELKDFRVDGAEHAQSA